MSLTVIDFLKIFTSICLFIIAIFYAYAKYKLSFWERHGVKSLPTHLIFGNFKDTLTFKKPPGLVLQEIHEKADPDDPYVGFYIFHQPKLLIRDFNLMKQIMIKDFDTFPNRCFGGDLEIDSVGLVNLLGVHQPRWKYLRQKLTPSVTGLKLRGMVPLISKCGEPLLKFLNNSKDQSDGWKKLELKEIASRYTTDVIASVAFGIDTNSFDENNTIFFEAGQKILSGVKRGLVLITLFFFPSILKLIKNFITGPAEYFRIIFWDSMNNREKSQSKRGDLIDYFISLKNGEQKPDYKFEGDNLLAQAVSFYVAGYEASSTAIAFALYELSLHPEYEEQLYREIQETISASGGQLLDPDVVNGMTFLDKVVSETLRMYPPLPMVDRVPVRDYKLPGSDVVLKKGVPVYVSLTGANRDPKYFERPNEFIPSRKRLETDISFGIGPRSCVGQRLGALITKIALITILKEYTLSNENKQETVMKPLTVFTAAADGIHVKLKKRN